MILSSLVVAAMTLTASSTAVAPFSNLVHFHPRGGQIDTRVSLTLVNNAMLFRDVEVDGKTYTVGSHGTLRITAPVGTRVYCESTTPRFHRGDLMLEVTSALDRQSVPLQ